MSLGWSCHLSILILLIHSSSTCTVSRLRASPYGVIIKPHISICNIRSPRQIQKLVTCVFATAHTQSPSSDKSYSSFNLAVYTFCAATEIYTCSTQKQIFPARHRRLVRPFCTIDLSSVVVQQSELQINWLFKLFFLLMKSAHHILLTCDRLILFNIKQRWKILEMLDYRARERR